MKNILVTIKNLWDNFRIKRKLSKKYKYLSKKYKYLLNDKQKFLDLERIRLDGKELPVSYPVWSTLKDPETEYLFDVYLKDKDSDPIYFYHPKESKCKRLFKRIIKRA